MVESYSMIEDDAWYARALLEILQFRSNRSRRPIHSSTELRLYARQLVLLPTSKEE
jgi:hypothetical protein